MASRTAPAAPGFTDIYLGLGRWRLWVTLGYFDFVTAFRRTLLGPLWQVITVSAWIGGLWLVFGSDRGGNSLLYIGLGVVHWGLLSSVLTSMPPLLGQSAPLIVNIPNPLSIHIFRKLSEQVLRWSMQLMIAPVLMVAFSVELSWVTLLILPNLLIVLLFLTGASFGLATLGARLPAIGFAVDAGMRLMFFVTPVFWMPGDNVFRGLLATWNPFTYLLELLRLPLMGEAPSLLSYQISLALAAASLALGVSLFNLGRNRIIAWL